MSRFCPNCGKEFTPDQKFCVSCGKPLPEVPAGAARAETPQAPPPAAPPAATPVPVVPPPAGAGGPGKKRTGLWIGIGVGAAVLLAIILTVVLVFAVGGKKNDENKKATTVSVPDVVGLNETEARGKVEDAGLDFEPIYKLRRLGLGNRELLGCGIEGPGTFSRSPHGPDTLKVSLSWRSSYREEGPT